jgi:5'-phosphate synthase pdxT subunit
MRIGILALQGGVAPHASVVRALGHEPVEVRRPAHLRDVGAMILPGGESTVLLRLLHSSELAGPLDEAIRAGRMPVLATCAGLILAAREVMSPHQSSFGWLDVTVVRNAWGRQLDSFEAREDTGQHRLVFIRAPRIEQLGADVGVLASLGGEPVLVRQGSFTAASFHPELTGDPWVHEATFGRAASAGEVLEIA